MFSRFSDAFCRKLRQAYRLRDDPIIHCDLIVALGYGLLKNGNLPDATVRAFWRASALAAAHPRATVVLVNQNYLGDGTRETERMRKLELVRRSPFSERIVVARTPCVNSIGEAWAVLAETISRGLDKRDVVVVCDEAHMRSVKLIWSRVCRQSRIMLSSIEAWWEKEHILPFCRSPWRWFFSNIVRHAFLRVLGLSLMMRLHQPVGRS